MATTTAAAPGMKLLVDTKAQRVLFAEAGKDVVDFLFSLLALPVATAVKLVGAGAMVGSVGNLYASIDKLDSTYVQPGAAKDAFLSPTVLSPAASANSSLLRLPAGGGKKAKKQGGGDGDGKKAKKQCRGDGDGKKAKKKPGGGDGDGKKAKKQGGGDGEKAKKQVATGEIAKGLVQGVVTYTVLDNLTVAPMSAISSITLLNTFAVRDLADLQEKTVQLGYTEGVAILKASLQSKTVLTDVFLGNKKAPGHAA